MKKVKVKIDCNSIAEDVLSWKCCGLHNMNMELTVLNEEPEAVFVSSEIELVGKDASEKIRYLYPGGTQKIEAGDLLSFYFFYDEFAFKKHTMVSVSVNDEWFDSQISGKLEKVTISTRPGTSIKKVI
jgi:hypothetical protein